MDRFVSTPPPINPSIMAMAAQAGQRTQPFQDQQGLALQQAAHQFMFSQLSNAFLQRAQLARMQAIETMKEQASLQREVIGKEYEGMFKKAQMEFDATQKGLDRANDILKTQLMNVKDLQVEASRRQGNMDVAQLHESGEDRRTLATLANQTQNKQQELGANFITHGMEQGGNIGQLITGAQAIAPQMQINPMAATQLVAEMGKSGAWGVPASIIQKNQAEARFHDIKGQTAMITAMSSMNHQITQDALDLSKFRTTVRGLLGEQLFPEVHSTINMMESNLLWRQAISHGLNAQLAGTATPEINAQIAQQVSQQPLLSGLVTNFFKATSNILPSVRSGQVQSGSNLLDTLWNHVGNPEYDSNARAIQQSVLSMKQQGIDIPGTEGMTPQQAADYMVKQNNRVFDIGDSPATQTLRLLAQHGIPQAQQAVQAMDTSNTKQWNDLTPAIGSQLAGAALFHVGGQALGVIRNAVGNSGLGLSVGLGPFRARLGFGGAVAEGEAAATAGAQGLPGQAPVGDTPPVGPTLPKGPTGGIPGLPPLGSPPPVPEGMLNANNPISLNTTPAPVEGLVPQGPMPGLPNIPVPNPPTKFSGVFNESAPPMRDFSSPPAPANSLPPISTPAPNNIPPSTVTRSPIPPAVPPSTVTRTDIPMGSQDFSSPPPKIPFNVTRTPITPSSLDYGSPPPPPIPQSQFPVQLPPSVRNLIPEANGPVNQITSSPKVEVDPLNTTPAAPSPMQAPAPNMPVVRSPRKAVTYTSPDRLSYQNVLNDLKAKGIDPASPKGQILIQAAKINAVHAGHDLMKLGYPK